MNNLNVLLVKSANKDQGAFEALYKEASPKLFSLCLRLVNYDNATAEEVLQEAFIKIWDKAEKFDDSKGMAMTWMGTVVRNQAFDRLRRSKSRPELVEEGDYETIEYASHNLLPEQQNSHHEQLLMFKDILESLPEKQQECVVKSMVYGYTHTQIAEQMGLPLGTVKAWLRRNLARFQEQMSDNGAYGVA